MHDWKYSMGDLVCEIEKMYCLTLNETSELHSILYAEQKKALLGFAYGQKLSSMQESLYPKKDLVPRPRTLYLTDLGEGMLVPTAFIKDFLSWEKSKPSLEQYPGKCIKLSPYPNSDT